LALSVLIVIPLKKKRDIRKSPARGAGPAVILSRKRRSVMNEERQTIGPLKKIGLLLEAGTGPDKTDLTAGPIAFEFIFGAGSQGLCPLEFQLADRKEGDVLSLRVRGVELADLFQHLLVSSLAALESVGAFYLKVKIVRVSEAEPKEVIKAMAEAGSCGDHCCGH
jgi:hypothetical protein